MPRPSGKCPESHLQEVPRRSGTDSIFEGAEAMIRPTSRMKYMTGGATRPAGPRNGRSGRFGESATVLIDTRLTQSTVSIKKALRKPLCYSGLRRANLIERRGQDTLEGKIAAALSAIWKPLFIVFSPPSGIIRGATSDREWPEIGLGGST